MAVVFSVLSYFFLDQTLAAFFAQDNLIWFWLIARNITNAAEAAPWLLGSLILWAYFKWIKPQYPQWRRWSIHGFQSLIYIGILVHIFKMAVGRQRPHKSPSFEANIFDPFNGHWDWASMPSGHSQVCFVLATTFALAFPKYKYVFYVVGAIFALTRVFTYYHFLSDVIMGAVIGHLGTLWVLYFLSKRNKTELSA